MGYLIVFLGGGIGAALRHGFNLAFARLVGTAFPYATLFENVSDSIVMGMLVATFAPKWNSAPLASLPHHRNSRGLYDVLDVFARCRVAV